MSENNATCEIVIRVRYPECDPMGYLHHARFLEYFEIARTEMLRNLGFRYRDLEEQGVLFVVARVECRFRRPARYDDELRIVCSLARQTRARLDHTYAVYRDNELLCEGSTVLACVDRTGSPIPIPENIIPPPGVPTRPAPRQF